ncbi:MAG TPA: AbrB family transcriptional regulator [Beijerinckiaceae bacterium]
MTKKRKPVSDAELLDVRWSEHGAGVVLPPDLLARLSLKPGDKLRVLERKRGEVTLSRFDESHEEAMAIAREVMDEYGETFKTLAK